MTTERTILGTCCVVLTLACALGCRTPEKHTNTPDPKVSSMVFAGSLDQVVSAITNAFGAGAYHGKDLVASPYDYVRKGDRVVGIPVTNRWSLMGGALPLTLVPRGKKIVAYHQDFEIRVEAVNWGSTEVIVTPDSSWVTEDRYELSMHLNRILGTRHVPPLASETTSLLQRIERQLAEIQAGRMAPLPPTPDTRPGYYNRFWTEMTVEERHDRHNWQRMVEAWKVLQGSHNFSLEPTAAALSVFYAGRRSAAPQLRRCTRSGGCGSAPRWAHRLRL